MIGEVTGERALSTTNHLLVISEERCDGQKIQDDANEAKLKELVKDHEKLDRRLILCAKNTGEWTTLWGNMAIVAVLAAMKFCGFWYAHYDTTLPNLQNKNNG